MTNIIEFRKHKFLSAYGTDAIESGTSNLKFGYDKLTQGKFVQIQNIEV